MRVEILLPILFALLSAAQTFRFTSPDPSEKINVSRPVEVRWEGQMSDRTPGLFDWLTLRFNVVIGSSGSGASSWQLETYLEPVNGSYTWEPNMTDWKMDILDDQVHYFEATLQNDWNRSLASARSERYAIEGYANLVSKGARSRGVGESVPARVLAGLVLVGSLFLA
jgi:hypothetical protein